MSVVSSKEWRGILLHFFSKEIKVLIFDRVIVILSLFFLFFDNINETVCRIFSFDGCYRTFVYSIY